MSDLELWFDFPVQVKERARFRSRRRGGPYTPDKTVAFEKAVRHTWSQAHESFPPHVPIGIEIEIHKEGFKVIAYELEESVRPVGILGDVDNYVKSILDGLQPHKGDPDGGDGCFPNDRQVEMFSVKFIGVPRKKRKVKVATLEDESGTVEPIRQPLPGGVQAA